MILIKKIASFLLLSIFCLTQVYAILPHAHHTHDDIVGHHHHHQNEKNSDDNESHHTDSVIHSKNYHHDLDLLIHLSYEHSHHLTFTGDDISEIKFQKKTKKSNRLFIAFLLYNIYSQDLFPSKNKPKSFHHLEPKYQINDILLGSYSYRGPPSLV